MRSSGIRHEQEQTVQTSHAIAGPVDLETALNALFEQNIPDLYEHIEETIFRAAYRFCHGNQLQTGRLLNISRNIVRARLEKIGELNKPLSVEE
ncbi:hypothetical protein D3C76_1698970 [compost metagenome]